MKDFSGFPRGSFRGNGSFFHEHDGNFVAHWIDAPAGLAFQSIVVGSGFHRGFAGRANEDVEQIFRDGHDRLREVESTL